MSLSALTTAIAVAAAAVPNDGAPNPHAEPGIQPIGLRIDPSESTPAVGPAETLPLVAAQATTPPQPIDPGLTPAQTTAAGQTQTTDPASPARPGTQVPPAADEQSDIVIIGRRPSPEDPLEDINAASYEVAQTVDKSIVAPIAFAYEEIMPRPVRKGLRNFLHNLGEPVVFLNYLLQLKPGKAAETLGRFAINSTLGAAGLVDVAKRKPFNLPHRQNGFANTLGYYGVKPGPYFYLPLVGPTTLRDFIGGRVDLFVLPTLVGNKLRDPKIVTPIWVLSELGRRIEIEEELSQIRVTRDPYVSARTHYLQKRQAEIDALRGRGSSTTKTDAPTPVSSDPAPPATSPAPVQDTAPVRSSIGQ